MYKFLMYWAVYTAVMFAAAVIFYRATDIDPSSMVDNAPVIAGIMALAITRKSED